MGISFTTFIVIVIMLGNQSVDSIKQIKDSKIELSTEESNDSNVQKQEEIDCQTNIQCWGKEHYATATALCSIHIQKLAKYDYEWTSGLFELKFGYFTWKDRNGGLITYTGDKIKFQNGFGAWQNYVYHCDYNPFQTMILDIRMEHRCL